MEVATVPLRRELRIAVALLMVVPALLQAQTKPIIAIDLDPTTPGTIQSALTLPGPVPSLDIGIVVDARMTPGIGEVGRIVFGATDAFNLGGATVTALTPLAIFDLIPGPPAPTFVGPAPEFQVGNALRELGNGGSFTDGPLQYARFRLSFGALPPASQVRVFIGDRGVKTSSVRTAAFVDLSGDGAPDGTPVLGTAGFDEGTGAGIDYRDGIITFGHPVTCSTSVAPACTGSCPSGGQCGPDLTGTTCACLSPPTPCTSSPTDECDGECPAGQVCALDLGGTACSCQPPPSCGNTDPVCDGSCPAGETCLPHPTSGCSCEPVEPPCEGSAPACGGDCPAASICGPGTAGGCQCLPITTPCTGAATPACDGVCPPDQQCRLAAGAIACFCAPADPPCGRSSPPQCGGRCTIDTQICIPDPSAPTSSCICADVTCAASPFPECGGGCPAGRHCATSTALDGCACVPDTLPCASAPAPECGGDCPAGAFCEVDAAGTGCACRPTTVPCSSAPAPACNGDCQEGQFCLAAPGGGGCSCSPPVVTCDQGPAPECGGTCTEGEACRPTLSGTACDCVPLLPSCQNTAAPQCGGACPTGSRCDPVGAGTCDCVACDAVLPFEVPGFAWLSDTKFQWTPILCPSHYNVYRTTYARLPDVARDGLADDYGACLQTGITGNQASDPSSPPSKQTHFYLVTAENGVGEGTMGSNSAGVARPNVTPCP